MSRALVIAAGLAGLAAGCGMATDSDGRPDGGASDAMHGCRATIEFQPTEPTEGMQVRATATVVDGSGVYSFAWQATRSGQPVALVDEQPDGSAVSFAGVAGGYLVEVTAIGPGACAPASAAINVRASGAETRAFTLRVSPTESALPPVETVAVVFGGPASYALGAVVLPQTTELVTPVRDATGAALPGYVEVFPAGSPTAIAHAFAVAPGGFRARLAPQIHDLLVVPSVPGAAPLRIASWSPGTAIEVDAGSEVAGSVRGPGGAPLAGAQVQLMIGGVPSTLATTTAAGAFALRARPLPGARVEVRVAPPAGSGLPRLVATSTELALGQPVAIAYAAQATRDVGGAVVRRGGAAVANAEVVFTGAIAAAGAVTTGATGATAAGVVRIASVANASGALPATLVPARALSAVTHVGGGDYAVSAVDLGAGVPAAIDAPARVATTTALRDASDRPLAGAIAEAVPAGVLALAGVVAPVRAVANASGEVSLALAAGGSYDLRLRDPRQRAAADRHPVATGAVAARYLLPRALVVSGTILQPTSLQPLVGAAVQLGCAECTGTERERPLGEVVTDAAGRFSAAVPNPGTVP